MPAVRCQEFVLDQDAQLARKDLGGPFPVPLRSGAAREMRTSSFAMVRPSHMNRLTAPTGPAGIVVSCSRDPRSCLWPVHLRGWAQSVQSVGQLRQGKFDRRNETSEVCDHACGGQGRPG